MVSSINTLMHIISVNMSALPHCQVRDKQEQSDNTNYMIVKFPAHVNIYILLGELWWNVARTQQVLLYSSVNDDIAHTAVQLQPNDRFSNCLLLYWLYKLYCSGWLEELHKCNDCSYTICTDMVLQWHCLLHNVLCSTAIDCCSAFRHKLLNTERSVNSNTVRMEEANISHNSGLCLNTASCNQLSPTVQALSTHSSS